MRMPRDIRLRIAQRKSPYSIKSSASAPRISSGSIGSRWLPSQNEKRCRSGILRIVSAHVRRAAVDRVFVEYFVQVQAFEHKFDCGCARVFAFSSQCPNEFAETVDFRHDL